MSPRKCRSLTLFFVLTLVVAGCDAASAPGTQAPDPARKRVSKLLHLMAERLSVMHDVARWKWNAKKAVSDPRREEELLSRLAQHAKTAGLQSEFARSFFQAQIEAAKRIQQADFDTWRAEGRETFSDIPDLQSTLRPRITLLSERLIAELAAIDATLKTGETQSAIQQISHKVFPQAGIDEPFWKTALNPLLVRKAR